MQRIKQLINKYSESRLALDKKFEKLEDYFNINFDDIVINILEKSIIK